MTWRPPHRIVLHLLLVALLAIPGIVAPARLLTDAMQAATVPALMETTAQPDGPCEGMDASSGRGQTCDCCISHTCDFSACLGTGLLPELPRIVAAIPVIVEVAQWPQPPVPTGMIGTPFRPPIA